MLIEPIDPGEPDAIALMSELSARLQQITGSSGNASFDPDDVRGRGAAFLVARTHTGDAVGCGSYRPLQPGIAEIKRMYARRGRNGVGSAILHAIEVGAQADGYSELWLETRKVNVAAVSFYLRHGYREIPSYGRYIGRDEAICLGKTLEA